MDINDKNTQIIIGVSIAVGVVILIFFIWWRVKKNKKTIHLSSSTYVPSQAERDDIRRKLTGI